MILWFDVSFYSFIHIFQNRTYSEINLLCAWWYCEFSEAAMDLSAVSNIRSIVCEFVHFSAKNVLRIYIAQRIPILSVKPFDSESLPSWNNRSLKKRKCFMKFLSKNLKPNGQLTLLKRFCSGCFGASFFQLFLCLFLHFLQFF